MSNDKVKTTGAIRSAGDNPAAGTALDGVRVAPLFRRIDWLTFLVTFLAVGLGYYFTLAPELTLEDSGELAVGSYYAGIPHPPGYPVWTIYTWLWSVLVPAGNIAWRVGLGVAFSGALAAALLGLLVSRGSSLLMEGIEELRAIQGRWENAICVISGFVAGCLLGFNGYMWSQSVIVEVYALSVCSFMGVMLFLLRWIYAPHQRRYLYLAFFLFGISFTNHQSLIVAAMGLEVAIAAANYRVGRWLFLINSICYVAGLLLKQEHMLTALEANPAILSIFHAVGWGSIAAYVWMAVLTKETFLEFCLDACFSATILFLAAAPGNSRFLIVLALAALAGTIKFAFDTRKIGWEWLVVIICGLCFAAGSSFYLYMALAGMTNPPMQWGYPRTIEGFVHAFTRGQYEKTNPSDVIGDPGKFINQLLSMGGGIVEEFNWVYAVLALVPFLFFFKLHKRERAWLIGIFAIYMCLGVLLLILLNPPPDRAAQDLIRVFFGASHMLIALMVGYGMTLIAAFMAVHYQRFRFIGMVGGAFALALALYSFVDLTTMTFFGHAAQVSLSDILSFTWSTLTDNYQFGLPVYASLLLILMAVVFLASLVVYRNRAPLLITLFIFALMPLYPAMTHWSNNEQREHWFGYWFGHDMFTPPFKGKDGKPLYPEMAKDAVLYGGTDPGRFCPTYMIFCDSLTDPEDLPKVDQKFDRRDVYIITQNALADGTYLNYIRAHYNRSQQKDPPFFQEALRSQAEREQNYYTNSTALMMRPLDRFFTGLGDRIEERRRTFTSWFAPEHFTDLKALVATLKPGPEQTPVGKFIYDGLTDKTRQAMARTGDDAEVRSSLAADLNVLLERELRTRKQVETLTSEKRQLEQEIADGKSSGKRQERIQQIDKLLAECAAVKPLYDAARFKDVQISEYLQDFIKEDPKSHTRIRLNRLLLEAAYPKAIAPSKGGVYPDREIYIASPDDSQRCFSEYLADAQRRLQHDREFPNEPKQLKPGEDVRVVDNRVQVSGQVAVMAINGLITKVMFDANPKNEFYVEESFPLDWMFPHLTPYGIIMKINRQPVPEFTDDIVQRDHEFWRQYSERLIGNWITYDTKLQEIADFVERVYLRRNFKGFTGDRKFVRDDQGQKAFSKLRSSIGGVYNYRIGAAKTPAERARMLKEADFAFKQAFAFCPYSPEAVFRYVNLLLTQQRFDDALIVASTCLKLDPYNAQVVDLVDRLKQWKSQTGGVSPLDQMEKTVRANPDDFQAAFNLAAQYAQFQQTGRAIELLDGVVNNPKADAAALRAALQGYSNLAHTNGILRIIAKLDALQQANPANLDAMLGIADGYRAIRQDDKVPEWLDKVLASPQVSNSHILQVAQQYAVLMNYQKLETALEKLVKVSPQSAEAWYDLAAMKASMGKNPETMVALSNALSLSRTRLAVDKKARDLSAEAAKDNRFQVVRQLPEFQQLLKL